MTALMNTDALQATALGKCSTGTSSGTKACEAGPLNARTAPLASSTA
jgi:hypothetical protein